MEKEEEEEEGEGEQNKLLSVCRGRSIKRDQIIKIIIFGRRSFTPLLLLAGSCRSNCELKKRMSNCPQKSAESPEIFIYCCLYWADFFLPPFSASNNSGNPGSHKNLAKHCLNQRESVVNSEKLSLTKTIIVYAVLSRAFKPKKKRFMSKERKIYPRLKDFCPALRCHADYPDHADHYIQPQKTYDQCTIG